MASPSLVRRPAKADEAFQEEMLRLNNELTLLSRENARKSRALEKALARLKEAQAKLVHQEKMASLGQMTAGVAHEINNPVAFVLNNHSTLGRDFDDLFSFVNLVGDSLEELGRACPAVAERILAKADRNRADSPRRRGAAEDRGQHRRTRPSAYNRP